MRTIIIHYNDNAPEEIAIHPYDVVMPYILLFQAATANAKKDRESRVTH